MTSLLTNPAKGSPRSLSGLLPFLRPYRGRIALAAVFLVLAALATLVFPVALRSLIDGGLSSSDKGAQVLALRERERSRGQRAGGCRQQCRGASGAAAAGDGRTNRCHDCPLPCVVRYQPAGSAASAIVCLGGLSGSQFIK